MYKITLSDGTTIDKLAVNGTNFVSKTEVKPEDFSGRLNHVVISCDDETDTDGLAGEYYNMELVQIAHYTKEKHGCDDGWYFVLREIPAAELETVKMQGDIAYLSMMSGIEL